MKKKMFQYLKIWIDQVAQAWLDRCNVSVGQRGRGERGQSCFWHNTGQLGQV